MLEIILEVAESILILILGIGGVTALFIGIKLFKAPNYLYEKRSATEIYSKKGFWNIKKVASNEDVLNILS